MERLTTKIESNNTTKYELKDMIPSVYGIHKLGQYEDAEEQGLLLRLPCKVGDIVYCTRTTLGKNGKLKREIVEESFKLEMLMDVGYAVFITREEAEQALERMEKSHE